MSTASSATKTPGSTKSASAPTPTASCSTKSVGKAKGIRDGDSVWLESPVRKVKATVKLTQCIHPQAVGVGGHFGHWAPGMPNARGKGLNFNSLLPTDIDHIDKISTALDHCVQVRVFR